MRGAGFVLIAFPGLDTMNSQLAFLHVSKAKTSASFFSSISVGLNSSPADEYAEATNKKQIEATQILNFLISCYLLCQYSSSTLSDNTNGYAIFKACCLIRQRSFCRAISPRRLRSG